MSRHALIRLGVAFFAGSLVGNGQVFSSDPPLQSLIDGNESAIALIRLIDMTFEIGKKPIEPAPIPSDAKVTARVRWTSDVLNDRERFRFKSDQLIRPDYPPSRASNFEVLRQGAEYRVLGAWDWDRPGVLTPFEQHGVTAWIDPTFGQQAVYKLMKPTRFLMWMFDLPYSPGKLVSLRQLVAMSGEAQIEGQADVCGRKSWRLMLRKMSGAADDTRVVAEFEIDIDATAFTVLRYVQRYQNPDWPPESGVLAEWIGEATEVKEFSGGALIPVQAEYSIRVDERFTSQSWLKVTAAKINEPLAADALDFRFPQYAMVKHQPAVNGKNKIELWGNDDRPIKEITNEEEDLREFAHLAPGFSGSPAANHRYWLLAVNLIVLVVVVGAWARRSRRQSVK